MAEQKRAVALISGGLDSTAITALMSKKSAFLVIQAINVRNLRN